MSRFAGLAAVLRERHFRQLFASRLVAQAGDGFFQVALLSYVFFSPERQATAAGAAGVLATLLLPYSLVGPFGGVLIDRWPRRRILIGANLLRAAVTLTVLAQVSAGLTGPPFYITVLALLSLSRFFLSAQSAALPHVVDGRLLLVANSLAPTSGTAAAFLGAAAGLGLAEASGSDLPVVACAGAAYLVSAAVAGLLPAALLGPDDATVAPGVRAVAAALRSGLRHLWERRAAARALAVVTASRFGFGLWTVLTLLLYRSTFTGLGGIGAVVGVSGAGFVAAALVTPWGAARWGERRWIVVALGCAAAASLLGLLFTPAWWLASAFGLSCTAQGVKICVDTVVQNSVDDGMRGRVFSAYDILFNVAFVAAAAVAAATVPADGQSPALLGFLFALYALTAAAYAGKAG